MATVFLSPIGNGAQLFDDNGVPLASGFVNTYAAGTTTPTATYTTAAGNVANANPIALNAAGRITTEVWIPQGVAVKFVPVSSVSQAVGTQLDNIYGINDPTSINGLGYTGATVSGALIMNSAPINEAQGANISVASQINLTTATGNYLQLTGSGTVTAVQLSQGAYRELVSGTVSAAFQNSTTLAMLGGASITPAAGDIIGFRGEGVSGVVRNVLYQRASGSALTVSAAPCFSAWTAGGPAAASVFTKIPFGNVDFNVNGNYDGVTNYRFTPSVPGKYYVTVLAGVTALTDAKALITAIYLNGSIYKENIQQVGATGQPACECVALINLNGSTDFVEAFLQQQDTTTQTIAGTQKDSHFSAFKII